VLSEDFCAQKFVININVLRSKSPSGMCAKLRTVATNNWIHPTILLYYCLFAPVIYLIVRAHSVRGEPRISAQRQRSGCNTCIFNNKGDRV